MIENFTPMPTICQDDYFTVGGMFYKNVGILTWRVSDCEELVGASRQKCE
jgi:hypothetical protein